MPDEWTPETVLDPTAPAPLGKIWCNHCTQYLNIGYESVSHQNLFRPSQVCMRCAAWNYLDEELPLDHNVHCPYAQDKFYSSASTIGDYRAVRRSIGGNSTRSTTVPTFDRPSFHGQHTARGNQNTRNVHGNRNI